MGQSSHRFLDIRKSRRAVAVKKNTAGKVGYPLKARLVQLADMDLPGAVLFIKGFAPKGNPVQSDASVSRYRPPAPEAWLAVNSGRGELETATRFPALHSPNGGYLNSEINALH